MDWVETIQSSPNPRGTDPNPVQSSWWPRSWIQSSPIRTQQSRYLPNTYQNLHVRTNDNVYSWRFEDRTSDVRVTIRRNCLNSLKMGYTLQIYRSSLIQNPLSCWISDPVQSKSAWTGLDYESSGLIQSIPYSVAHQSPLSGRGLMVWYLEWSCRATTCITLLEHCRRIRPTSCRWTASVWSRFSYCSMLIVSYCRLVDQKVHIIVRVHTNEYFKIPCLLWNFRGL